MSLYFTTVRLGRNDILQDFSGSSRILMFFFPIQQADLARKDRLARSLSIHKLKFPFPNMVGVCVQESSSGSYQLLSQGTGEILLEACVDYWNGSDLCPLSVADR